ncbi:PPA1309 family protein [Nocardioides houyundeii]|uniref:PPA1309 family protein n=1 Tax=Nocardioides houyundeii TaxID=2045452 RepID=UPI000C79288D|nr:PPA1309 family protein [Nocardioides houyundeii]
MTDPQIQVTLPDPALAAAVLEIETHVASLGWDQPARMYALVGTQRLVESEPELAASMGLDQSAAMGSLTPVEQERLPVDQPLEQVLESIVWPERVDGCAVALERLVLPPGSDAELPEDPTEAGEFARNHPLRQEVRLVAGVTRTGSTYCALRLRAHDDQQSVVDGTDLVPGLIALLSSTFDDEETQ